MEGGRKFMDMTEGLHFQLRDGEVEGMLIQSHGVVATVYTAKLWEDSAALLAIMREDNLDAEIAKRETELDAFGHVSRVVSELTKGYERQGITIKASEVMAKLAEMGYGTMPPQD